MKLLVFDVEGTLFQTRIRLPGTTIDSTIWQAIAYELGSDAVKEEVDTHRRWERGEYKNYLAWMVNTIAIHRKYGLTKHRFKEIISAAEYNQGVVETLKKLNRSRYEPLLVSGGFRELATRAQIDLKIFHSFAACEYFFGEDGKLEAYNLLPCDFEGKIDFIHLMLREFGLNKEDWIFVGDGLNDVPVAKVAPVAIGYRPHPELRNVCMRSISDFRDLVDILAKPNDMFSG